MLKIELFFICSLCARMTAINLSNMFGMSYMAVADKSQDMNIAYHGYKIMGRGCMFAIYKDYEAKVLLKDLNKSSVHKLKYFALQDMVKLLGEKDEVLVKRIKNYNPEKEYVFAYVIGFDTKKEGIVGMQIFAEIITID